MWVEFLNQQIIKKTNTFVYLYFKKNKDIQISRYSKTY